MNGERYKAIVKLLWKKVKDSDWLSGIIYMKEGYMTEQQRKTAEWMVTENTKIADRTRNKDLEKYCKYVAKTFKKMLDTDKWD